MEKKKKGKNGTCWRKLSNLYSLKNLLISYQLACYQQWLWYPESLCLEIRSRWGITGTATSKSPSKLVAWNGIHKKNPLSLGSARGGRRTLGGGGEGHHLWLVVFEVRTVKNGPRFMTPPPPSRALRTRAINLSRVLGPFITVRTSNTINMRYKNIL